VYAGTSAKEVLALRAVLLCLLPLVILPATARAATVRVEPYVEPPYTGEFGCSRYMSCPPDMVVFAAAAGETNRVTITEEWVGPGESRFAVRDEGATVQADTGCAQIDPHAVACNAGAMGRALLDDGDDQIVAGVVGVVSGGAGNDSLKVLQVGNMRGEDGEDVLVGPRGEGGPGDDVLTVVGGFGGSGDDVLRCFPTDRWCYFDGGPGADVLTGGTGYDRLFGRAGDDILRGGAEFDTLKGGQGRDRLVGGADGDHLHGDSGADRLVSREDRSAG
jgi:Ca2+-binding RTX toxin-like protein